MTEPQRSDLARDLIARARQAREYHAQRARGLLREFETDLGRHLDHANARVLQRITTQHGWPGRTLVGEEAAEATWQLALHVDHLPDLQRTLLDLLDVAVKLGEASRRQWAHLFDRCAVNAGQPQLYGTQYHLGPDGVEPLPIWDPEHLDARRARVGLPPHGPVHALVRRRHSYGPQPQQSEPDGESERTVLLGSAA
ncbi:DUF6624 domain-containing protein [Streptomyces acidiscabies]|uniref:Uncharacterized protein n=1 Tax=Streptomyces acidiscabies TaxID=42234 RepID=A0AAP6B5K2_9ACTN|nr:DUF6624 domain-containing protein [Streptomyces acidiscabies]MBP5941694.1 hypothetical protein [Streptomyces sp. LBUM 1476]MBZ3913101.1 hypothetical protein [Streptomyces acidiscabies]MDX2958588.1 hypothetical protein [Streptomyces acidiscabies]MDX3020906.1 hypothetical protein [Streptomyces acidiscabies]MDX3790065.1 hypothetical protein [Streptomyces acidiscabies]